MKSNEMKITVYRNDEGVPSFRYPKEWDCEKVFEQIAELCCVLQEELSRERWISRLLRNRLDHYKAELDHLKEEYKGR